MLTVSITGAIQVFYSKNTRETGMYGVCKYSPEGDPLRTKVEAAVRDPANYEFVTAFEESDARDLDDVWEAMQSEVSDIPRSLKKRSMMVGDLIVYGGYVWVVDSSGFARLDDVNARVFEAMSS